MIKRRDDIGGAAAQGVRGVPHGKLPAKADPITGPVLYEAQPRPEPPKPDDGRQYVDGGKLPKSVAPGRVLAHNHVQHNKTTPCGERGFRAWTWPASRVPPNFKQCDCGWSGLPHVARPSSDFLTVSA